MPAFGASGESVTEYYATHAVAFLIYGALITLTIPMLAIYVAVSTSTPRWEGVHRLSVLSTTGLALSIQAIDLLLFQALGFVYAHSEEAAVLSTLANLGFAFLALAYFMALGAIMWGYWFGGSPRKLAWVVIGSVTLVACALGATGTVAGPESPLAAGTILNALWYPLFLVSFLLINVRRLHLAVK